MQERTVFSEADLVGGGGGGVVRGRSNHKIKTANVKIRAGGFPTSTNLSFSVFIVGPCLNRETLHFLQNFAKSVHEE